MSGKIIEELQVGMAAELTKTYNEWDVNTFAAMTGDLNPAHVDQAFAEATIFKEKIAHGLLTASLISAVLGMKLPGPGSIYLSQELRFLRPVRIGDTITARVEVIEHSKEKGLARLRTACTNQKGELVLDGTALVIPPKVKQAERESEVVEREGKRTLLLEEVLREQRVGPSQPRRAGFLVGDWMRRSPLTISAGATLTQAKALLDQHRIRHLPVVEGEELRGIITDRDIRQASFPGPPGKPALETEALLDLIKVGEAMNRNIITTTPSASIGQAAKLFTSHQIGGLPVLESGRLVGIITETDLLLALAEIIGV